MKALRAVLLSAVLTLAASAADISGTWSGSLKVTGPDGQTQDDTVHMILKQEGGKRVCDTEVEYAGKAQESREILAYQYARLPRWQREHDNRQLQTKLPTCVCLSVLIRVHLSPIFVL